MQIHSLKLYQAILPFNDPEKGLFLKVLWEKRRKCWFPPPPLKKNVFHLHFFIHLFLSSANVFILDDCKIVSFGKKSKFRTRMEPFATCSLTLNKSYKQIFIFFPPPSKIVRLLKTKSWGKYWLTARVQFPF